MRLHWTPPRLRDGRLDFTGCAPPGHCVVGVLHHDHPRYADLGVSALAVGVARRADAVLLAEVLDVGSGCPGIERGALLVIQRSSAAARVFAGVVEPPAGYIPRPSSGIDPEWLGPDLESDLVETEHGGTVPRHVALTVVRVGNAIQAQSEGVDDATVDAGLKVAAWKAVLRRAQRGDPDMADPKSAKIEAKLREAEAHLVDVLARRRGRCVNRAIVAAGCWTGDDGSVFDGAIAVLDGVADAV